MEGSGFLVLGSNALRAFRSAAREGCLTGESAPALTMPGSLSGYPSCAPQAGRGPAYSSPSQPVDGSVGRGGADCQGLSTNCC